MQHVRSLLLMGFLSICGQTVLKAQANATAPQTSGNQTVRKHVTSAKGKQAELPAGTMLVWKDRGELSPSKVYWGAASAANDPLTRVPAPPFTFEEKNSTPNATSPKVKIKDNQKTKWTVKLGVEVHADVVAPRLAWALGFGAVEGYYVNTGKFEGVTLTTDLGKAKGAFNTDGTFQKIVSGDTVELNFTDINRDQARVHQRIPLAHAQWFRKQLAKLTDDEIQAAFDAAYATDGLNHAYATGDAAQIKAAREHELSAETRQEISGFVAAFRARITDFLQKIPTA